MSHESRSREEETEHYKFLRLYSIDFDLARGVLRSLRDQTDPTVRRSMLRDVLVTYCRPFSGNRGHLAQHRLSVSHVPLSQKKLHDELYDLRRQLVAHTDLTAHKPSLVRWQAAAGAVYPMSFKQPLYDELFGRLDEMGKLVEAVDRSVLAEVREMERVDEERLRRQDGQGGSSSYNL